MLSPETRSNLPTSQNLAPDAAWIWLPGPAVKNSYVEFTRDISGTDLLSAWIQLSAETSLRLFINGQRVYAGPPREVRPYFYFETLDLLPHLHRGRNELRIIAHHQGENSQSYQAGAPAILVAGECEWNTGKSTLAEASSWKARRLARYKADSHRLFSCLGYSEHIDFTATEGQWTPAVELARHPWIERPLALPRDLPPWRTEIRRARHITPLDEGLLVDMGEQVSGYVELSLGARRPGTVRVSYGEALEDGKPNPHKGGLQYWDRLDLSSGAVRWESYEKRAFRYAYLDRCVDVHEFQVREETWPLELQRFADGQEQDELLDRIMTVSARTLSLNCEDLLTDCPWRERAQYLDCQFSMGAMQKLFGTIAPIKRFLHQFPRGADESGLLRMCYPSPSGTSVIPDFSISYAMLLQRYLELSGDLATVRKNLPLAERGITVFRSHEDEAGLLAHVPGWIFLDNTFELPKFPRSAGLNAMYHGGYLALASLCESCGETDRAREYGAHAVRLRAAFRQTFLREDRILDADSTECHESFKQWNYHYSSESGRWQGAAFRLKIRFRLEDPGHGLHLCAHAGTRAWIDGNLVLQTSKADSWTHSAIFERQALNGPFDDQWHLLDLDIQWSGIDWECYLASRSQVEWSSAAVWEEDTFGNCLANATPPTDAMQTWLRPHSWPWMSQITVGLAAFHGLLEANEARTFLGACLPETYPFPFAKRTTPFFAKIENRTHSRRILPCNVPASLFYFCHALKRFDMAPEARSFLLPIYEGMLKRGATTWWEEWNTRSSLCHAWTAFVVEFLDDPPTVHRNV